MNERHLKHKAETDICLLSTPAARFEQTQMSRSSTHTLDARRIYLRFACAGSRVCGRTMMQDSHPPLLSKARPRRSPPVSVYQYIIFLQNQIKNEDYTLDYKGQVYIQSYHGRARYQGSGRAAEAEMVDT